MAASEKLVEEICETILWRTFNESMVNVTASYSLKHILLKAQVTVRALPC